MRFSLLALLVILFGAATSVAAPSVRRPRGAAAPAKAPQVKWPEGHKSARKAIAAEPRIVSWTYDKLHHPQLVAAALRDVAAGKLPRTAVDSLASKATLDRLLAADLPERAPVRGGRTVGGAPKGQTRAQAKAAAPSEWQQLTDALAIDPEFSPKQLEIADAYDKEVKRASVWFTASTDGFVTATLPAGAPFRIEKIVSYDGSFTISPIGPLMNPWDSRTTAPFALSVRAGQQFAVTVAFEPKFELGKMMAGEKKGKLKVNGAGFAVSVPISATFNGVRIAGILLSPTEDQIVVDGHMPTNNLLVTTKMQVLNIGNDARTATIAAETLPSGMTLVGAPSVALGAGESKSVDVTLEVDGGAYGYGQPLVLRATAPGGFTSSTNMTVNVVKAQREWVFIQDVEGVELAIVYRLDSTGHWFFSAVEHNTSSLLPWEIEIQLELGGDYVPFFPFRGRVGTMGGISGPKMDAQNRAWKDPGPDGRGTWSKDFYAELLAKPAQFIIQMESIP